MTTSTVWDFFDWPSWRTDFVCPFLSLSLVDGIRMSAYLLVCLSHPHVAICLSLSLPLSLCLSVDRSVSDWLSLSLSMSLSMSLALSVCLSVSVSVSVSVSLCLSVSLSRYLSLLSLSCRLPLLAFIHLANLHLRIAQCLKVGSLCIFSCLKKDKTGYNY